MSDMTDITMYEAAYQTREGYREVRGVLISPHPQRFREDGKYGLRVIGVEVFHSKEEALAEAAQQRSDRIASLEKTLAKLRSLPVIA